MASAEFRLRSVCWVPDGLEEVRPARTITVSPSYLPAMFREEYRIMRASGTNVLGARYHVCRMVDMITNFWAFKVKDAFDEQEEEETEA